MVLGMLNTRNLLDDEDPATANKPKDLKRQRYTAFELSQADVAAVLLNIYNPERDSVDRELISLLHNFITLTSGGGECPILRFPGEIAYRCFKGCQNISDML